MIVKPLYKITREDGGITITPNKPSDDIEYTEGGVRIIAEEDKYVTKDGINSFSVYDTDSSDGWYEIDRPKDEIDDIIVEDENIEE